jgi:hypothetical protein
MCGIQLSRMNTHHPAANRLVERFQTEMIPLVLLGIRTTLKEDLQASVAELVYSES